MEVYETFHWLRRQTTWGESPLSCLCSSCAWDCVCNHSVLVTSDFKKTVQVPTNWLADTPASALRKRTNSLRETAGPRRARLIKELAKEKTESASKL